MEQVAPPPTHAIGRVSVVLKTNVEFHSAAECLSFSRKLTDEWL